jgi:DNA-binding NarL/FixJ family response regulator
LAQILLADDNQVILQLLRRLIESHAGWQVCGEASNGQQALAKAMELKPDVMVLDFAMPGLNGLQVAAEISRACPTLPMILHTIHDFPEMISEAKKVGIREVVSKTDDSARLLDVMERLLAEKSSTAAAGALMSSTQAAEPGSKEEVNEKLQNLQPPEPN